MQPSLDRTPVFAEQFFLCFQKDLLQSLIKLPGSLFFGNTFVALQALHGRTGDLRYGIGKLSLSTSSRTFDQKGLAHFYRPLPDPPPTRTPPLPATPKPHYTPSH